MGHIPSRSIQQSWIAPMVLHSVHGAVVLRPLIAVWSYLHYILAWVVILNHNGMVLAQWRWRGGVTMGTSPVGAWLPEDLDVGLEHLLCRFLVQLCFNYVGRRLAHNHNILIERVEQLTPFSLGFCSALCTEYLCDVLLCLPIVSHLLHLSYFISKLSSAWNWVAMFSLMLGFPLVDIVTISSLLLTQWL